jgi:tRNA A-37 threonylcarbamoyl transferase component Bud32
MPKQLTRVGKYVIVDKMAKGGMGSVYKAKHPTLKRYVILKQLTLRGSVGISERFKREAQLMIDFRHENIVPVYDHFRSGSSYFIAMEFVDGTSLDRLIAERGRLSTEAAILIFTEICKGLKYAHDKGVVHRDIKPANILISNQGEVKIVDFGIATTMEADTEGLTRAGMTLGTPAYMSPEQIADSRKVDKRSDIYSMGVMLYEMLTGEKPFPGDFTPDSIDRINRGRYKKPKRLNRKIPSYLVRIIRKMMHHQAKRRYSELQQVLRKLSTATRRYRSPKAIRGDIKRYLEGSEVSDSPAFALGKGSGMRPLVKVAMTVVIFLVVLVGGSFTYYNGYVQEYLMARKYGRIEVQAMIPTDYYKPAGLVYAYARFTPLAQEASDDVVPVARSYRLSPGRSFPLFSFLEEQEHEGQAREMSLSTGGRYLLAGPYRVETYVENRKYYSTIYLNPRIIQKDRADTFEGRILQYRLEQGAPKPVELDIVVLDSETGDSLWSIADIDLYLADSDRWVDWKKYRGSKRLWNYLRGELRSGMTYRVRVSAPSYFEERLEIFVEPNLDAALIEASLIKKPGTLVVESNHGGLGLLIDNRKEAFTGTLNKEYVKYGSTVEGNREFRLHEGNYVLTVRKSNKNVKNFQFTIRPGRTTRVQVSYDEENKEIDIR